MKLLNFYLISVLTLMLLSSSCIDGKYHLDNLNTDGVLKIPPIPLGSYEKITLADLDYDIEVIKVPGKLPTFVIQYQDTLRDIFGKSVVKDFFHKYMERDLSISGNLDVDVLGANSDWKIDLDFNVLDANNNIIEGVDIKGIENLKMGNKIWLLYFLKKMVS